MRWLTYVLIRQQSELLVRAWSNFTGPLMTRSMNTSLLCGREEWVLRIELRKVVISSLESVNRRVNHGVGMCVNVYHNWATLWSFKNLWSRSM